MIKQKSKALLSMIMIVLSLFLFATPNIDANSFDTKSEKVLDFEENTDQDNDEEEKNTLFFFRHFLYNTIFTCKLNLKYAFLSHNHLNNASLFKPPIFS